MDHSNLQVSDFTKIGNVIQFGNPPLRIYLLTDIDGVKFVECFLNKKMIEIDGASVNFIGYWDLNKNKKSSSRLKDINNLKDSE